MAYLGKTPSQAVRQQYFYTATGGETSLSGADDNGNTLTYTDGNYVDVFLNGILLVAGTDYNTTTANTIGGLTALSASDVVEIVVYDVFSVFGGDVQGDLTISNGTLTAETVTASGLVTAQDGLVVDNDGATVATLDRATSDGTIVEFQKNGSTQGSISTVYGGIHLNANADFGVKLASITASGAKYVAPVTQATSGSILYDGQVDLGLGVPTSRFKNLYLSGGVYLGGTGAANYLDDYEEGTFSMSSTAWDGDIQGDYIKIGKMVTVHIAFNPSAGDNTWATSDSITGLPFTAAQTTNGAGGSYNGGYYYGGYMLSNQSSIRGRFTVAGATIVIIDGFSTSSNYSASITYITN